MTVKKTERKAEKALAKEEKKVEEAESVNAAIAAKESRKDRGSRLPPGRGSFQKRLAMQNHVKTAQFIACIFDPFNCPSRLPDKLNLMKTIVLPFRQTGTMTAGSPAPTGWHLEIRPFLQNMVFSTGTGTLSWGSAALSGTGRMFTGAASLTSFIQAARCCGLKIRVEYASAVSSCQGVLNAAVLPPGAGSSFTGTGLSQFPMSSSTSVTSMAANGCFEIVWLPQSGAGDYTSTLSAQDNAPYSPLDFVPFNVATTCTTDAAPHIEIDVSQTIANAVFMITIEAAFECDVLAGAIIGSDDSPPEEAWDVLDDYAEPLFQSHVGVQPIGPLGDKEKLAPQSQLAREMITAAPSDMSSATATFLDEAAPIISKIGEGAWDMVKEYGPDVLSSVVGLLPGGSLATTAAKIGGALGKFFL